MANWKLPYSIPKFTDAEFEQQRADYIAKYGYTIYVPGWEDIIHMPLEKSFTEQEELRWAAKDWDFFTPTRLDELKAIKERRRRMYLRLLGSPQPKILRNRGSILVALDNNQDALSTLSMIIRIAYTVVPLVWKKILTGPVGWIMTMSDILNLCTYVMTPERSAIRTKRIKDTITDKNPFSRKARLKRSMKLFKEKIGTGTIIEALQTTDQVFGYGISLGAIMNLPFDMALGSVRRLDGAKVTMLTPDSQPRFWTIQAANAWKSLTTIFTTRKIFDVAEALPMLILSHLVAVAVHVALPTMDPNNEIVDLDQYMVKALEPKKAYLREIMEENGDDPDDFTGWPLTNEKESSCTRIAGEGYKIATTNFQDWCYANRYSMEAFYGAQRANDAAHFMLATLGGDDAVEYDYTAAEKSTHSLLNLGYRFPFTLTRPSGYYDTEGKFDKDDILPVVADAQPQLSPTIQDIIALKPQILYTSPSIAALKSIKLPSDQWTFKQFLATTEEQALLTDVDTLRSILHENQLSILNDYFTGYEATSTTPSTPNMIQHFKENHYLKFPINHTTETPQ